MGSILALFRPSGPLCFPVRQGAFSASGGRAAAATGAAGGFYVSFYKQWYKNWLKTITSSSSSSSCSTVFRCGEGCVSEACSTCSSSTSSRSSSSTCYVPIRGPTAAAAKASAAAGALFLPESRRDVKPRDSMFLEVVPSFFFSMGFRSYVRHSEEE